MHWEKLGVIWKPNGDLPWARRYATCPTPWFLPSGELRLYIQCRDERGVGRVGYVDVDPSQPTRVLQVSPNPVLDVGAPGAFDDNGVFQTSVVRAPDGRLFMYYVGFELCHHIRYRLLTGLAVSTDEGETFQRIRTTPILERSPSEMHFRCGPFVIPPAAGRDFRMWYVAGSNWEEIEGKQMPIYDVRYAESVDGVHWPDQGRVVLPVEIHHEHGFGRPYIIQQGQRLQMYYSVRKRAPLAYRLGYAESEDGLYWHRQDDAMGLDVTPGEWDGESIEYGAVVHLLGRTFCFYNGNDFGVTGFGVAELQQ